MRNISRTWALIIIGVIAFSSLTLLTRTTDAQTTPAPSVPTFTVKLVDNSYTTPTIATSSTDPYTNKTTITQSGGQYVKNFTIEIIITNQALPSSLNDGKHSVYYSIRLKPHFSENWTFGQYGELMPCNNSLAPDPADASVTEYFANVIPKQSDGFNTTFPIDGNYYNQSDQIDFQVKAVIGHTFNRWVVSEIVNYFGGIPHYGGDGPPIALPAITQDSEGNWSAIQTLTVNYSPSNVNISSSQPNDTLIISYALIAIVAVIAIVISLLFHRRHRKTANKCDKIL